MGNHACFTPIVRTFRTVLVLGSDVWDISHHSFEIETFPWIAFLCGDLRWLGFLSDLGGRKMFQKGNFCDASSGSTVVRVVQFSLGNVNREVDL
jgi:hypothetical protein